MEMLNSLGRALCTCVCWECALVCVCSLQRGLGSLAPEQQELLTPQPLSSARGAKHTGGV